MVYVICFFIALLLLLYITANGRIIDFRIILLIVVVAISNGGYYALASSENLREAILANNLCYILGIFSPLIVFLIICNVCQLKVPRKVCAVLYAIQLAIYLCACTIGKSTIFYKTVEFNASHNGAYLTKTYGPVHAVYLVTLIVYTVAGVAASMYSLKRGTLVSRINVDTLLVVDIFTVCVYLFERMINLKIELVPIASTITAIAMLIPLLKISKYSIYNNQDIFEAGLNKKGYIIFDRNLKYMGSSDRAKDIFPELGEWELEKKIPGNGGRFNTFLRQPLMHLVQEEKTDRIIASYFEYKGETYNYEIGRLGSNMKKPRGYFILVSNVTDVIKGETWPASNE